ncbi:MAG: DUF1588 domain-containing protein [Archangiaceae bacterium]|nr:DUF1588 domain-containing protein [Archangiaceae bacterium]
MNARLLALAAVLSGCEGLVTTHTPGGPDGPSGPTGAGGSDPASTGGSNGTGGGADVGGTGGGAPPVMAKPHFTCTQPTASGTTFASLRRMTRTELINTWSALVGATVAQDPAVAGALSGLPVDDLQTLSTVSDAVPATWVGALSTAANRSATVLLQNPTERARVLGTCSTQALTDACVQGIIAGFGVRVWRRDLDPTEVGELLAFYKSSGADEAGLGYLVRRLLQAPTLAFHFEDRGTVDGPRLRLTPFEVASRISYLTTASTPDDALLAAARAKALATPAQVRPHVLRLLATAPGHARVRDLMRYYMQLGDVAQPFAPLARFRGLETQGLNTELRTEALDFAERVFFDSGDGTFAQLMTSDLAVPKSERLAKVFSLTCGQSQAPISLGWNDATAFFHPDGSTAGPAAQTLTQSGWFVWQLPSGRLTNASTQLRLDVVATSGDGVPLDLDVNLDDAPLIVAYSAPAGARTLTATVNLAAGAAAKVGLHFKNAAPGRTLEIRSLSFVGAPTTQCTPQSAPSHPGLLHRPALLAGNAERTSPILRGAHVRKLFLCTSLGTPDPALVAARQMQVGDLDGLTNRERVTTLTADGACAGCHTLINPAGFPFEAYDQAGMRRTAEQRFDSSGNPTRTQAIDTTVDLPRLDYVGGPSRILDSTELVRALADSQQARACFTQRAFEYLRRSALDSAKDGCALAAAEASAKSGSLRDVLADLISADDTFFRLAP